MLTLAVALSCASLTLSVAVLAVIAPLLRALAVPRGEEAPALPTAYEGTMPPWIAPRKAKPGKPRTDEQAEERRRRDWLAMQGQPTYPGPPSEQAAREFTGTWVPEIR